MYSECTGLSSTGSNDKKGLKFNSGINYGGYNVRMNERPSFIFLAEVETMKRFTQPAVEREERRINLNVEVVL